MSSSELFIPSYQRFTNCEFDSNDPIGQQIIDMIMAKYYTENIYTDLIVFYDDDTMSPIKEAFELTGRTVIITDIQSDEGAAKKIVVSDTFK